MVIHFIASASGVVKNIDVLRRIVTVIYREGHVLAHDWIEPSYHLAISQAAEEMKPEQLYALNMSAIERADIIIVEETATTFGLGYQVATALQKKRPVLLLAKRGQDAQRSRLSQGIQDPLVVRKEYTEATLEKIVKEFIKDNTVSTKDLRFNFVIDRQLYNHIRWRSFKDRKTKAEVVRELLWKDMDNKED